MFTLIKTVKDLLTIADDKFCYGEKILHPITGKKTQLRQINYLAGTSPIPTQLNNFLLTQLK